ncbi:MAG: hypothetical protein IT559_03130 [Alphaproteobacteria bacterium]|nr:hypothetical protein [Alphaproteobacteria bacterium]
MKDEDIKAYALQAIAGLKKEIPPLAFTEVHERSTAHRLAVHLEPLFPKWNIDCEYDRDGLKLKILDGIKECDSDKKTDRILPDIIVHHRNESGPNHNLLVIEIKKNSAENTCDRKKLELLTGKGHYQYQLGLYVNINGGAFDCTWYKNGRQLQTGA